MTLNIKIDEMIHDNVIQRFTLESLCNNIKLISPCINKKTYLNYFLTISELLKLKC